MLVCRPNNSILLELLRYTCHESYVLSILRSSSIRLPAARPSICEDLHMRHSPIRRLARCFLHDCPQPSFISSHALLVSCRLIICFNQLPGLFALINLILLLFITIVHYRLTFIPRSYFVLPTSLHLTDLLQTSQEASSGYSDGAAQEESQCERALPCPGIF